MAAARLIAVVVFPTPPFWLAMVRIAVMLSPSRRIGIGQPTPPGLATQGRHIDAVANPHTISRHNLPARLARCKQKMQPEDRSGAIKTTRGTRRRSVASWK